jgi:hypothetical protein
MTSRRIDFTGLTEFLAQFGDARDHMLKSQREFLLSLRAGVDVLLNAVRKDEPTEGDSAASALLLLRTVLDYLLSKVPDTAPEATLQSKLDALSSVLDVLAVEERRLSAFSEDELAAAKIDAVRAIRKVVEHEMDRARAEARRKGAARVRKVTVE